MAGKLDSCAQLGCFLGYDLESKVFHIYWPTKQSVMVEQNVIFNDGDVTVDAPTVIPGDSAEGEKEKVIQMPENNTKCTKEHPIENTPSKPRLENNTNS